VTRQEDGGELLEIVDESGCVIRRAPRGQFHGDPSLAHRAVHVFVKNSCGDFFLQKRSHTKRVQPGRWDTSVGGHLAPGESYEAAALRELEEELGVRLTDASRLRHAHDYVWRSEIETEHVRTFVLDNEGPFTLHPEEIDDGRFWSEREMREAVGTGVLTPNLEEELRRLKVIDEI
jgi:isopentenyldiphosphate isomerase